MTPQRAPEPLRPPAEELLELWQRSQPVTRDVEVMAWFTGPRPQGRGWRALLVQQIAALDLARVIPPEGLPSWAAIGARAGNVKAWTETGHRLLVPLFSATGKMESCKGRCVFERQDRFKSLPPFSGFDPTTGQRRAPYRVAGLVFANEIGRCLLATGASPSDWPAQTPLEVLLQEGELDFLARVARLDLDGARPAAVFGCMGGSWTAALAERIPAGSVVTIDTHHDDAGDDYANRINATLRRRCAVLRSTPHSRKDA